MQILVLVILAGLAYYLTTPEEDASVPRGRQEGFCTRVVDGDTLEVRTQEGGALTLRLLGVDCMEVHNEEKMARQAESLGQPPEKIRELGEQAKKRIVNLASGRPVAWIIPDRTPIRDDYGRVLAYVEANGSDLGELLLREGLAEPRRERHPRRDAYREIAVPLSF
jgi:endonuclease YncB( thermonuclease family)